ncbi:MAG: thiamine biosynthesis protein ThiS [Verrucomicrobiaceae bacterium]|nr:thiamine biosynthesis protein ThiS [Verrucomicrobiaceae bacterium]
MIEISVNGKSQQVDATLTLASALTAWGYRCEKVAVAINSEFVSRVDYQVLFFSAGDLVDIVVPVAGG